MGHAPLPPSSAARIVACHGSAQAEARYPDEKTQDSLEGDAAHWAGAELLRGQPVALGQVAPNGVVLNNEMIDAAEMWAEHVRGGEGAHWVYGHVEETFPPALHPDNWGTPDYALASVDEAVKTVYIDDFKYGHRFVDERWNWQLLNYAVLVAARYGHLSDDSTRLIMTIVQPRNYHRRGPIRTFTCTLGEARAKIAELSAALVAASQPGALVTASDPDQCFDCKARHECEAFIQSGHAAVALSSSPLPLVMSARAMKIQRKLLMRAEKTIKGLREGIDQSIMAAIKRGEVTLGMGVEFTPGKVVWNDDAATTGLPQAARALNVPIEKPAFITPTQALKAGLDPEIVKLYSRRNYGAAELVEFDEDSAANVFKPK